MEEAKFNNLCSHYKNTIDSLRLTLKTRDNLFYLTLALLAIFTLQLSSTEIVVGVINDYIDRSIGISLGNSADLISTLLWLFLLGISIKYFQIVLDIERQYKYLHSLEKELNIYYKESIAFTEEGKEYAKQYPLFSNWVWLLYTIFFPVLIIFCVTIKIIAEINSYRSIESNQIINFISYLMIGTSSILYLYQLHKEFIQNVAARLINYFRPK